MKKLKSIYRNGAFALPVAIAFSGSVFADPILIDPDGSDVTQGTELVDALDWSQTSSIAVNVGEAPVPEGAVFRALTTAQLGNFQLSGSNLAGTGLNVDYEWTVIIAFHEEVIGTADPDMDGFTEIATFQARSDLGSALHIFHDTAQNADQLAGTGFEDGSGPILSAVLANDAVGTFIVDTSSLPGASGGPELLDQFGGDDWGGQQTLVGNGSTGALQFSVTAVDNDYFPGMLEGDIIALDLFFGNVSQQDPFQQVDPARQIWDAIDGAYESSDIGPINLLSGPDNLFQTDYNTSFDVTRDVPEPSTIALLGAGLTLIAFGRRRRRA